MKLLYDYRTTRSPRCKPLFASLSTISRDASLQDNCAILAESDPERAFVLTPDDFALLNPNTRTCPVFRSRTDADLTKQIYRAAPILVDENNPRTGNPWGIRFYTMFHMTNDSGLFRTAEQLDADGFWHGADHAWHKGDQTYVRLYEGKMVQMFDHRAARVLVDPNNLFRPARPEPTSATEKAAPGFIIRSQFYVPQEQVEQALGEPPPRWLLGYKDVTAPTNRRTLIMSPIPFAGVGNTFCLIRADQATPIHCLIANLASFALDYVARQKVHGQHLNFFVVKQLPVLPPSAYETPFKGRDIRPWIRERVLELTYTSEDMRPFAEDLGYDAPPFTWDETRRRHLRCQLDALYFHLYNLDKPQTATILDTFPIVHQHDQKHPTLPNTRNLILSYHTAYTAGDLDAEAR